MADPEKSAPCLLALETVYIGETRRAPPHGTSIEYIPQYQLVMVGGGRSPDVPVVCVRARVCVRRPTFLRVCRFARALQGGSLHTCTHACVGVYLGVIGEWAGLSGVFARFSNIAALLWLPPL